MRIRNILLCALALLVLALPATAQGDKLVLIEEDGVYLEVTSVEMKDDKLRYNVIVENDSGCEINIRFNEAYADGVEVDGVGIFGVENGERIDDEFFFFQPLEGDGMEALEGPYGDKQVCWQNMNLANVGTFVITADCEQPELLASWIDWFYSDDGSIKFFMGTEGETFDIVDGEYIYQDWVTNSPDGRSMDEIIGTKDYAGEQEKITKLGENHVFYLPYLMGERSPHNDPKARATFIGMSMDTTREEMTQAVLEGVAFGLRDSLEVARSLGIKIERTKICGGGAKSPLWKKIIANVMNLKVDVIESEEGPGYGGAMLAAVGCGEYDSVQEAADQLVKVVDTVEPDAKLVAKYEAKYQQFRKIYPALKGVFQKFD